MICYSQTLKWTSMKMPQHLFLIVYWFIQFRVPSSFCLSFLFFYSWQLFGLQSKYTDESLEVIAKKKKIEKQINFENLSLILEASLESSFQMWFQTIYLFPILMYLGDFSFTSIIVWRRIMSIVASFLATAYSIVYSR